MAHGTDAASSSLSIALAAAPLSYEEALIGTVLGSYKVLELLGKGGMGCVFRAKHRRLDREVALKLLRSDYSRHRDVVTRFFQEARTVNRIRHRHIVDVTDFVELPNGTTFIVMELLRGQRLGPWARGGVDLQRVLGVLVQVCEGLAAAHEVGVIHRDLKPDNIVVVPSADGTDLAKILDFGVAKLLHRDDEDFGFETQAGTVIGTPAYMSPEQAGGLSIDARSDVYSLGAIMYTLFCGQPVFRARSFGEYVRKHLNDVPPPPSATPGGAQIDPHLELVILRCLQKEPTRRFATILDLRDVLLALLGELTTHPPAQSGPRQNLASLLAAAPAADPLTSAPVTVAPPRRFQVRRRRWWFWMASASFAIGIGAAAGIGYTNRTEAPTAVPPRIAPPAAALPGALPATSGPSVVPPKPAELPLVEALEEPPKPVKPRRKKPPAKPLDRDIDRSMTLPYPGKTK